MNKAYKTLLAAVLSIVLSGPALAQPFHTADPGAAPATAGERTELMYPVGNEPEREPK